MRPTPSGSAMRGGAKRTNRGGNHSGSDRRTGSEADSASRSRRGFNAHEARGKVDAKLLALGGPTHDLEALEHGEMPFSSRARLYIGNLPPNFNDDRVKEMLEPYGKIGECYHNKDKRFAFARLESRAAAEKAKRELNGKKSGEGGNHVTVVRFAANATAVKVTGLSPTVTNELLAKAFSVFGPIERCLVYVDCHGRSKEEGIVEFVNKFSAEQCAQRCREQCFFLTAAMKPVEVELFENHEDDDGFSENMAKLHKEYAADRQRGPRLVGVGSFEHDFGAKWKELRAAKREALEALERDFKLREERLIASAEISHYAFETDLLRKELMEREANIQRNMMKLDRGHDLGFEPSRSSFSPWDASGSGNNPFGSGNNPFSPRQMPSCPPAPVMSSQPPLLGTPPRSSSLLEAPPSKKDSFEPRFRDGGMDVDRGPTHDGYGDGDDQKRPRRF